MKIKVIIGLLILSMPTFGQINGLDVIDDLSFDKKYLIVDLKIENRTDKSLYIHTGSLWLPADSLDFYEGIGLFAFLESETGNFIPYVLPINFSHSDNVKRDFRKMKRRVSKYPKAKLSPSPFLILDKQSLNSLDIRIPIENWYLAKGHRYKFVLTYFNRDESIKPPKEGLKQVGQWKIIEAYFDY